MRFILKLLPLIFLAGAAYSAYSLYTEEVGLLQHLPLLAVFLSAFTVSLAWRISPSGTAKKVIGICLLLVLITGVFFYLDPTIARSVWMIFCVLILVSVHSALLAISAASFLFSDGRKMILLLPVILSVIGVSGLFLWNGTLVLSGIGLVSAIILAFIATLFGMPKTTSKNIQPEDN